VPELIQEACTPQALVRETRAWLDDPGRRASVRQRFQALHATLCRDTAGRATDALAQILSA
jgi:lipid-A-disaccharide synthase